MHALARNRLQTMLTISGMSVGVATVLTMIALGTGAQKAIQDQVRAAGMNVIVVTAGNYKMPQQWTSDGETEDERTIDGAENPTVDRKDNDPENAAGLGGSDKLSLDDAMAVAALSGVQYCSAGLQDNARVAAGDNGWFTRMHGEGLDMPKIRRAWVFPYGRFFTKGEMENAQDVAVLGSIVSQRLFGDENPIGKKITAKGHTFTVIGEIASDSWMVQATQGDDQFDAIYIPVTTMQAVIRRSNLDRMTVSTASTGEVTKVSQAIGTLLRRLHGLGTDRPSDFIVATEAHKSLAKGGMRTDIAKAVVGNVSSLDKVTLDQLGKTLDRASRTMTLLLASVATVSLVVGGIGIMNIMLLSVTERTREIGIRRAVGARSAEVMLQFLMEAILLSAMGGLLGIFGGVVAAQSISSMVQWSTSISPWAVALSFGISAAVGILFGYYPAREASRVSPMTSLRYE